MNTQKGFSLLDILTAAISIGAIASAAGAYQYGAPKAQFSESIKMMDAEVLNMLSANAMGLCTVSGSDQTIKGKYGILTVSGAYKQAGGPSCPIGCTLTYKFNNSAISKQLAGKIVAADVTADGELAKNAATNVPDTYTKSLKPSPALARSSCANIINGDIARSGINKNADSPTIINEPGGSLNTELTIDKAYRDSNYYEEGYYVKGAVNAYEFATLKLGREPNPSDNLTIVVDDDVAIVGYATVPVEQPVIQSNYRDSTHKSSAAIIFDARWNNVGNINLINKGGIYGAGGSGAWWGSHKWTQLAGENGRTALLNTSNKNIAVKNSGSIAGGGGGGSASHGTVVGGGGAPFAQYYAEPAHPGFVKLPTRAKLTSPGMGTIWVKEPEGRYKGNSIYGGTGGGLGENGTIVTSLNCCLGPGTTYSITGGKAGSVKNGLFSIKNTGSGWYKGADITSVGATQ